MDKRLEQFVGLADAIVDQEADLIMYKNDATFLRRVLAQIILTNGAISVDPLKYSEALNRVKDLEFRSSKVCLVGEEGSIFTEGSRL